MAHVLVFDSGVGGLSIAGKIRRQSPDWRVDYAADSGFFPYGIKTDDELKARLPVVCAALVEASKPDALVIACNTASTLALEDVRAAVSIPVVGTVPAIKPAAAMTKTGVIGVLATPGTVRRAYLDNLVEDYATGVEVIRHGAPGLVELAERHVRGEKLSPRRFELEVCPLFEKPLGDKIDVVVLACTHFPLVRKQITATIPEGVTLIDTGEAITRQVSRVMEDIETAPAKGKGRAFLTGGVANLAAFRTPLERYAFKDITIIDV